jgi:hypothetical protein
MFKASVCIRLGPNTHGARFLQAYHDSCDDCMQLVTSRVRPSVYLSGLIGVLPDKRTCS